MKRLPVLLITLALINLPVYGRDGISDFRKIVNDLVSVNTVKAEIKQRIYAPDGSVETFEGAYTAAAEGRIRIDYSVPEKQRVIVNSRGLYWYYPERKLLFMSEKGGVPGNSPSSVTGIIPGGDIEGMTVTARGIRFYSFFQKAEVYSIMSGSSGMRLVLWIDPERRVVVRKYLIDGSGREIIREDYLSYVKLNGISIPSVIELRVRGAGGVIRTITEYSNMVINKNIDEKMFDFRVTPEMRVKILNER